jgi:hypothetical protein
MGLGSVDTWTLAEARERARLQRQLLDEGKDPIEARTEQQQAEALEKAKAVAFQDCAKEYIKAHKASSKSAKHADQWTSTLETWVYPNLGKLPVGGITADLVLKVLQQPISDEPDAPSFWTGRTETASRVRGRIETVLDWAKARKMRHGENPARWKGAARQAAAGAVQGGPGRTPQSVALRRPTALHGRAAAAEQHQRPGARIHDPDRGPYQRHHRGGPHRGRPGRVYLDRSGCPG